MKALILAGGFGTRIKTIVGDVPKPMISVAGKPFLEHQIRFLKSQDITDIVLAVHHMADKIKSYFGNGKWFGVDITYSEEEVPLGTAGAIKNAQKYINDTFFVLNGDSYSQIDLKHFIEFHKSRGSNVSLSLAKSRDMNNYGNVVLDGDKIINFAEKGGIGNFVSSGVYLIEPTFFDYVDAGKNVSIEQEVFPKLAKEGKLYGYSHSGYFMDIGRPETLSQFKKDVVNSFLIPNNFLVRDVMKKITKSGIDLALIVDESKKLIGVLNDKIIKDYLLNGGNVDDGVTYAMSRNMVTARDNDPKDKIYNILLESTNRLPIVDDNGRVVDVEFRTENIKDGNFPVIRGKAPLRISFAGGGTDLSYFFEKYGGVVISSTINKYCYATIVKRADSKIIISSDMYKDLIVLNSKNNITYDGQLDIVKAIIKIMNPDFGFELYLYNDIPPGRGLGSSASLAVLIIKLICYLQDTHYDDYKVAEIAYRAEIQELNIKGGWQDQYAAVTGGFNFMEFGEDKSIIYPLRLKREVVNELTQHILLCYVGNTHFSGKLHDCQEQNFVQKEEEITNCLKEMKCFAVGIKDALLTNDLNKVGELLHKSWINKKKINNNVSNFKINNLYEVGISNGAYGGKLLGAGGGGYLLFFHPPLKRNQICNALKSLGGEILDFNFEFEGVQVWPVKGG